MNTIENGMDRQQELTLDEVGTSDTHRQESAHEYARIPKAGVPSAIAREWARADIEGLTSLHEKDDRLLPLAFMALNMNESPAYHAALKALSPDVENEVATAGVREVQLRTGLLDAHRHQTDIEHRERDGTVRLGQELDARMSKAGLQERGWRDRGDINRLMKDLEAFASSNPEKASALWEKYRPGDQDKPRFIDGDDKAQPKRANALQQSKPVAYDLDEDPQDAVRKGAIRVKQQHDAEVATAEALRKRYLIADNKYYFRDDVKTMAFEDTGKRLATEHDDPAVAQSMVALAAAKNWTDIKVKGSDEFRREAWLAASIRGMEVQGYIPNDVDLAKLVELRDRARAATPKNEIQQGIPRERAEIHPAHAYRDETTSREAEKAATPALSKRQQLAVDTLKEILQSRGDSDKAIAMAVQVASERFQDSRVYVGKVLEHGVAPYKHASDNEMSYFVKLQTKSGERTVWGADLPRALAAGDADKGDAVALTFRGRQPVTVQHKELGSDGKPTGQMIPAQAKRNTWEVSKLEKLQDTARERLEKAAGISEKIARKQPAINVYDYAAPRRQERASVPVSEPSRTRQKDQSVPR